ncbi:hypothetical protein Tco_0413446 [Tanacetum coccineum]
MELTPLHILNLTRVLTDSKRIIKANYTHFVTLSLLFLPLCVFLLTGPTLHLSDHLSAVNQKALIYHLIYIPIVYILVMCAITTITYTTHHGFLGKPVSFSTALKSLTFSFFPIISTAVVANTIIFLNLLSFLTLVGSILMLAQTLGFVIDYNAIYWFVGATVIMILIYFHVEWSLSFVVVVVESKWGFGALMRSSYLVKGMRSASLLLLLYFGTFSALLVWVFRYSPHEFSSWVFVFYTILGSSFLIWLLLHSTVANTVLYNYCKALHGELAIEIAEGFDHEYSNLSPGDVKVPHAVTEVTV